MKSVVSIIVILSLSIFSQIHCKQQYNGKIKDIKFSSRISLPDVELPVDDFLELTSENSNSVKLNDTGPIPLALCDCKYADLDNDLLNCNEEGYFINKFEKYGIWLGLGPKVPLSRSLCCRPCLPSINEKNNSDGDNMQENNNSNNSSVRPISIITVGCQSTGLRDGSPVMCDGSRDEFVVGFASQGSVRGENNQQIVYPVGPTLCCKPAVLLSTGELWKVSQCDCQIASGSVGCQGQSSGYLLQGFQDYKADSGYVPTEPATCCKPCLKKMEPMPYVPSDDCAQYNMCSNHGICSFGTCICNDGYDGTDCSKETYNVPKMSAQSRTWILAGAIMAFAVFCAMIKFVIQFFEAGGFRRLRGRGWASRRDGFTYIQLDEEGSVGSQDTSIQQREQQLVMHSSEQEQSGEQTQQESGIQVEDAQITPDNSQILGSTQSQYSWIYRSLITWGGLRRTNRQHSQSQQLQSDNGVLGVGAVEDIKAEEAGVKITSQAEDEEGLSKSGKETAGNSKEPGAVMMCRQCNERSVQVILVPCGHSTMCRRCSRLFQQCPECETRIIRKQKLFLDVD